MNSNKSPIRHPGRATGRFLAAASIGIACIFAAVPARSADPDNCLLCHRFRGLSRLEGANDRLHLFFVDPEYSHAQLGAHARLACTDCHLRDEVAVIPHQPVTRVNCTTTCHLQGPGGNERRFSHENIAELLSRSVHRPESLKKLEFSSGPLLEPRQSECLFCHDEPMFRAPMRNNHWSSSTEGASLERCDACHAQQPDTDIDYYLRHIASRLQPARSNLETAQVCAVCHSDPEVLRQLDLPNSVASYVRSFHGKAALLGDEQTAGCVDCHAGDIGPHAMPASDDAASPVHPTKLADSCSTIDCHPAAAPGLSEAAMHLDLPTARGSVEFLLAAAFILITLATFGPSALLVVLELLQLVLGRQAHGEHRMKALTHAVLQDPKGRARLKRFSVAQRVQHWTLVILFVSLAVTGFPLKFADRAWAGAVVRAFGGLHITRQVHHWAGIALVVVFTFYLGYIVAGLIRRSRVAQGGVLRQVFALPMWIGLEDARKLKHLLQYLLLLRPDRPIFGRFSIKEKFEYLGVFWGTVLLGATGLLLWGEQLSSHFLSGRAFNIAAIAHTYEAFLAVIHVGILHIYAVVFSPNVFPLSPAMITGDTPTAELEETHGQLIEQVAAELNVLSAKGGTA